MPLRLGADADPAESEAADRRELPIDEATLSVPSAVEAAVSAGEADRAETPVRVLPACRGFLLVAGESAEALVSVRCDAALSELSAAAIPLAGSPASEIPSATAAPTSAPPFAADIRKTPITAYLARNRILLP